MKELSDWARTLLAGRHYTVLVTRDVDGSLHLTPVWYPFRNDQLWATISNDGS